MDKILEKLSRYEFIGYLLPGIVSIFLLLIELPKDLFIESDLGKFMLSSQVILIIGILSASYILGTLTHELSEIMQKYILLKIMNGFPSDRILGNMKVYYSDEFIKKFSKYLKQDFLYIKEVKKETSSEVFSLIYSQIQLLGLDSRSSIFNSLYGLYRNLLVIFSLYFAYKLFSSVYEYIIFDYILCEDIYICISLTIIVYLLCRRIERFGFRFAKFVIDDYLSSHKNNH
ncbi:hypothetical protein LEP1GSC073_1182 [Leptospira noguchii str. Cascata]|nr:hypothetical protein LEP1GSC073_1182 [Leptospira noguchii str. Cascata]